MTILDNPEISEYKIEFNSETYWNGKAYMPIEISKIFIETANSRTIIRYEERFGEYTKSNILGREDENVFNSITNISNAKHKHPFKIKTTSLLRKLLSNDGVIKIETSDKVLKEMLEAYPGLIQIFKIADEHSDFDPDIIGTFNKSTEEFTIEINYLTRTKNDQIILLMIDFIKFISSKI